MSRAAAAAVLLAGAFAAGCASTTTCRTFRDPPAPGPAKESVQVTFLGVGGVLVRWAGASVMTGPFYSNPTVAELALSEIHSDRERVDALLHEDVADARAILVGHSHYDHAMDVPFVALRKATKATVLGNDALVKLLAPIASALPAGLASLERRDACADPAYVVSDSRFRVWAIRSEHSPQIGKRLLGDIVNVPKVTLWRGEPLQPLAALPSRVGEWPAGTTLAFVIDLLEAGTDEVAFRIYYQDSPTRQPVGYPPPCLPGRPVDLAILCVGGATELPHFPGDIVRTLHPGFVLGIHWEDFFEPRPLPLPGAKDVREKIKLLPGVSRSGFLRAVRRALPPGARAAFPCPEAATTFSRTGSAWSIAASDARWSAPK
ncbi:MAG: hypothetical protein DMF80_11350 [Acidobacteria bacterium]|nr:MAG: hypothetical protein DMF80_11350 [Acidobacteriota bacterium]